MPSADSVVFTRSERDALYKVIQARRDIRHFIPNSRVENDVLMRIIQAGHQAPSVGLMQPWRFIRITDSSKRNAIFQVVDVERKKTASAMDKRKTEFLQLKLEGIRECAELIAVVLAPDDGTVLGRRTMPKEMALCSTACAIENMWLASRAENLGMGWVSFFDPNELGQLLGCPETAQPIALLCIGPVKSFYKKPMLIENGWRKEKKLQSILFDNQWSEGM